MLRSYVATAADCPDCQATQKRQIRPPKSVKLGHPKASSHLDQGQFRAATAGIAAVLLRYCADGSDACGLVAVLWRAFHIRKRLLLRGRVSRQSLRGFFIISGLPGPQLHLSPSFPALADSRSSLISVSLCPVPLCSYYELPSGS